MTKFHLLFFMVLFVGIRERVYAQESADTPTRLLRIYEDNDFMNIRGQATDDAYTNGTRIDYFYTKKKFSRSFLDRVFPKAGDSSVNIFSWGVMELMYTPGDLSNPDYQPNDYPWSAALAVTHSLYSYNPQKKYALQTEWVLGVMGPAALGEQTQKFIHRVLQFQQPMGWSHQYQNAPLVNINFTAEKQLWSPGPNVEVIGGSQVYFGSMMNGIALYPLIRIGKMAPYFKGFFSQYTGSVESRRSQRKKRIQAYFVLKPEGQLLFTEALLQGGLFTTNPNLTKNGTVPYHDLSHFVYSLSYGGVLSSGHFGVSFIQDSSSPMLKGLYSHEVENLSVYYAW